MPFTRGHKINVGRVWSKERNIKVGLALNRKSELVCLVCGTRFKVSPYRKLNAKYCSKKCWYQRNGNPHEGECIACGKEYLIKFSRYKRYGTKFCSKQCNSNYLVGKINPGLQLGRKNVKGKNHPMWGKKLSLERRAFLASVRPIRRGPDNNNRKSPKYKQWARAVKEKDDFTCQKCNLHGVRLESDHIKPFSLYPDLRFNILNGQTLCYSCHKIKCSEDMVIMRRETNKWTLSL